MPNTLQTPADPTVAKQVQENFTTYFRLFDGLPGITFTAEDVTWIASHGVPGSLVLSTQLSSDEADQQIDETLRRIGEHTNAVDWFVFPGCQPADLGSRLAARAQMQEVLMPNGCSTAISVVQVARG